MQKSNAKVKDRCGNMGILISLLVKYGFRDVEISRLKRQFHISAVVDVELLCEFVGDADGVAVMASQWWTSQF